MSKTCISIRHLSKSYIQKNAKYSALSDVSIDIESGDIFGIIGMSGAGKSTLIRCLTLLERPTYGTITINGIELNTLKGHQLRDARKQFGMIFQHFNLFSARTAEENVEYPLEINHIPATQRKKRSQELLELVGLSEYAKSYPAQLSGGQKQRVAIARALANQPSVLFCDEATSSLDPKTTRSILDLLTQLNKTLGLTIVLITHEMEVVKQICNRVAVLEKGEVVETGTTIDLFSHPKHATTRFFLQHMVHDLSDDLVAENQGKKLFRLYFKGDKAKQPIISQLIRRFSIDVNILLGSIDHLRSATVGNLLVEFVGDSQEIEKARKYLDLQGVGCEEVK